MMKQFIRNGQLYEINQEGQEKKLQGNYLVIKARDCGEMRKMPVGIIQEPVTLRMKNGKIRLAGLQKVKGIQGKKEVKMELPNGDEVEGTLNGDELTVKDSTGEGPWKILEGQAVMVMSTSSLQKSVGLSNTETINPLDDPESFASLNGATSCYLRRPIGRPFSTNYQYVCYNAEGGEVCAGNDKCF